MPLSELLIILQHIDVDFFMKREKAMSESQIKELVEVIAKALADYPDQIVVSEINSQQTTVIELRAAKQDLGKIIGKQGRNAQALRTIVNAAATKLRKRAVLEILD